MRKVSCSRCSGTGYDDSVHSKCPDCNGSGSFAHWNEGQDPVKLLDDLDVSREWLEASKSCLMAYVSGGQYQDSVQDRKKKLETMRWERDYWAFRVQSLQAEIELIRGKDDGGESIAAKHKGLARGQDSPSGTGPGAGILHEGRVADGESIPTGSLGYRIP
jgi:hypothetical protein